MPTVDWADHGEAHRAVMRLFNPRLPGESHQRRAAAGVLYRVDLQPDGEPLILVQTRQPVELLPPSARALTVPEARWRIPDGQRIMFRVAVNPLSRRTVKSEGAKRREVVQVVAANDMDAWLTRKIESSVKVEWVVNRVRSVTKRRRGGLGGRATPPQVVVDTVDVVGVVCDSEAFTRLRLEGVGRAKAYGCGLLTAVPVA